MRTIPCNGADTGCRDMVVRVPSALHPRLKRSQLRSGPQSPFVQPVTEGTEASTEGGRSAEQRGVAVDSCIVATLRATETNAHNHEIPPPALKFHRQAAPKIAPLSACLPGLISSCVPIKKLRNINRLFRYERNLRYWQSRSAARDRTELVTDDSSAPNYRPSLLPRRGT